MLVYVVYAQRKITMYKLIIMQQYYTFSIKFSENVSDNRSVYKPSTVQSRTQTVYKLLLCPRPYGRGQ